MKIECFNPNVRFLSNMYLIYSGNEAAIIDPSLKYEQAKDLIEEAKLNIKYIFVTVFLCYNLPLRNGVPYTKDQKITLKKIT